MGLRLGGLDSSLRCTEDFIAPQSHFRLTLLDLLNAAQVLVERLLESADDLVNLIPARPKLPKQLIHLELDLPLLLLESMDGYGLLRREPCQEIRGVLQGLLRTDATSIRNHHIVLLRTTGSISGNDHFLLLLSGS